MIEDNELIHKILETIAKITSHAQKRVVTYDNESKERKGIG